MERKQSQFNTLIDAVEQRAGKQMQVSTDFDWLSQEIQKQEHQLVSANTLKRLWGYFEHVTVTTRKSVLDLLAHYLGYSSYAVFQQAHEQDKSGKGSNSVKTRHLESRKLTTGQMVCVTWHPDRRMLVEHLGDGRFIIKEVENSKLSVGDTFDCHLMIEGETLYLGNLSHEGAPPVAYQAGKMGGIHFEVILD